MEKEMFDPFTQGQLSDKLKTDLKQEKCDKKELEKAKKEGYSSVESYNLIKPLIKEINVARGALNKKDRKELDQSVEVLAIAFGNVSGAEVYPQDSDPNNEHELKKKLYRDRDEKGGAARFGYPSVEAYRAFKRIYNIFNAREDWLIEKSKNSKLRTKIGTNEYTLSVYNISFKRVKSVLDYLAKWEKEELEGQ